MPPTILSCSIRGNIAAGKSTVIEWIRRNAPADWIVWCEPEPIEDWTQMLKAFYSSPDSERHTWSFFLQTTVLARFMQIAARYQGFQELPASQKILFITERSPGDSRNVFVPANHFSIREREAFDVIHDTLMGFAPWLNDQAFYLRASADVCYERYEKRGRPSENGLTYEYMRLLHELYEQWSESGELHPIDAERTPEDIGREILEQLGVASESLASVSKPSQTIQQ